MSPYAIASYLVSVTRWLMKAGNMTVFGTGVTVFGSTATRIQPHLFASVILN